MKKLIISLLMPYVLYAGQFNGGCPFSSRYETTSIAHAYICKECRTKWHPSIPVCVLCTDGIEHPVRLACGHQFHGYCLSKFNWNKPEHVCPICKKEIELKHVPKAPIELENNDQ